MLQDELQKIFMKAQMSTSCHQKLTIVLTKLYKETAEEEFLDLFLRFVKPAVCQVLDNMIYTKRTLSFISRFCSDMAKKEEKEKDTHNFLTTILQKILQWADVNLYNVRFHSCLFIAMVLQDIGEDVQLEINLIDEIQAVLLKRMQEPKNALRLVAMSASVRLQDPQNFECPVVQAYVDALGSSNPQIRREATEHIAPNLATVCKIKDRIRDTDPTVRSAAFRKCADIGPFTFKIVDKHTILVCGFKETNEKVKSTFFDYLLPKWLTAYDGNYLNFVGALKLVADDEDFNKWAYLSKELITEFYNKHPVDDLIDVLPINDEKLIDSDKLTNDITIYWNILIKILRETENMDDYINRLLPELTPFCGYLDRMIKSKSMENMDEWKLFEYQLDLLNLLEIAQDYDFSDEVGRRTIQALVSNVLTSIKTTTKLTKKLVKIALKCSTNIDFFTNDMCQIISEIREPLVEQPLTEDQIRQRKFKEAELRVQMNIIQERQTDAVSTRQYQLAQTLDDELAQCKSALAALIADAPKGEGVRSVKNDSETVCKCLDIFASMLEMDEIQEPTPSLVSCKDHFLVPIITHQGVEPHWRVLKCLSLYAFIDKATAEEFGKLLCVPLATYRTIPTNNVPVVVQAINAVTDLISLYGVEIISPGEEPSNNSTMDTTTKRKLYNTTHEDRSKKVDSVTLSSVFEIFMDMLDDEYDEIRFRAVLAIIALIKESFPVTPAILSRIIIKWYNPTTEKHDHRLQFFLGHLIELYLQYESSAEVIKEAVVPTLSVIAKAPKNSPLLDIDMDNLLLFFSEMLNIKLPKDDLKIFALDICMKISEESNDKIIPYLTKFLCHLDLQQMNLPSLTELIDRASMLLESIPDRSSRRFVEKFQQKLRHSHANSTRQSNEAGDTQIHDTPNESTSVEASKENESESTKKTPQIKRKKNRMSRNCVVLLERMHHLNVANETTLHTIVEDSGEMDNMSIDSVSSVSSKTSKKSEASNRQTVITETSDSDLSNETVTSRRSRRIRKKRALT